ncbi:HD domain-containing protein [Candidatus Roizmanbacteria bacterium]|nr:HD domain-containing protein [Candidatus Roizmanbacteria bacterium]
MTILPAFVTQFMASFREKGYQIYLVGGSARDMLLDKEIKNWDFTTNAHPEAMMELFPDAFYNNQFGTVGIPLKQGDDTYVFEVTTFRKESAYTDQRHPDTVEWAQTVEEDLARRDFTINAIAYDGEKLIDPFQGQEDLKQGIIRAVGDPDKRFTEDALRLMRGVRFTSQLGFFIEDATRNSITRNAELITRVSGERIRDELLKIVASNHPAEGILFLRNTQLLHYILPEVDRCFKVPQKSPKRHHIYDVGTHLTMALKHCPSSDVITRFATLLHDIGKADTFHKDPTTQLITFYNHEVVSAILTEKIAKRLRLSNEQTEKLVTLVKYHQFTVSEIQTDKAVRRFIRQIGQENIQSMLDLRTGDRIGSGATPTSWRFELFKKRLEEVQHEPFKVTDLKVDGRDVMEILAIKPGRQVGETLDDIFSLVEDKKLENDRDALLTYLRGKVK